MSKVASLREPRARMATIAEHSFASCYVEHCRQQRVKPLPMICVGLPHSLDFTTDRVKMDDWTPILNSLSLDRTLRSAILFLFICVIIIFHEKNTRGNSCLWWSYSTIICISSIWKIERLVLNLLLYEIFLYCKVCFQLKILNMNFSIDTLQCNWRCDSFSFLVHMPFST